MIIPTYELFEVNVNSVDCSSLEKDANLYYIFENKLNNSIKKNLDISKSNELSSPHLNKKLKFDDDDTLDQELVNCEVIASAQKKLREKKK